MSFKTIAIATAIIIGMNSASYAEGHESSVLSNFSISASSVGDIFGTGSPNTQFTAAKDAFNDVQLGTDVVGEGCGVPCTDIVGNAVAQVYEIGFLNSLTTGDASDELYGSSMGMSLDAAAELVVGDTTLRDTSSIDVLGDVYGYAVGENVSVVTEREAFGKVQQDMAYHGSLCPEGLCGSVTQGTWAMGSNYQSAHVTAAGHEAIAISNVTNGSIFALLENYKTVSAGE